MVSNRKMLLRLADVCDLCPDMRLGQVFDTLGFLAEDKHGQGLGGIEDKHLVSVIERFDRDLKRRDGRVASPLRKKLKKILKERFPAPDKVELRGDDGIIGVVTSKKFRHKGIDKIQAMIGRILKANLTPEEMKVVLVIIGQTPGAEAARREMDDE